MTLMLTEYILNLTADSCAKDDERMAQQAAMAQAKYGNMQMKKPVNPSDSVSVHNVDYDYDQGLGECD